MNINRGRQGLNSQELVVVMLIRPSTLFEGQGFFDTTAAKPLPFTLLSFDHPVFVWAIKTTTDGEGLR